jgi:hypothetical protein
MTAQVPPNTKNSPGRHFLWLKKRYVMIIHREKCRDWEGPVKFSAGFLALTATDVIPLLNPRSSWNGSGISISHYIPLGSTNIKYR